MAIYGRGHDSKSLEAAYAACQLGLYVRLISYEGETPDFRSLVKSTFTGRIDYELVLDDIRTAKDAVIDAMERAYPQARLDKVKMKAANAEERQEELEFVYDS